MNMRRILIYFAIKYRGNFIDIYNAIKNRELMDEETLSEKEKEELENAVESNSVITILDENYPDYFKHVEKPPFVLFLETESDTSMDILKNRGVAVLGDDEDSSEALISSGVQVVAKGTHDICIYNNADKLYVSLTPFAFNEDVQQYLLYKLVAQLSTAVIINEAKATFSKEEDLQEVLAFINYCHYVNLPVKQYQKFTLDSALEFINDEDKYSI